ncbi:pyridoxamine 5'-phosphate oxidase family protein [Baekduia soli]|nr:pyridoxamine 5'-phosphate oxidase family protein [Baekduia soli]
MTGITWEQVQERLRGARTYWLATTRADGRPHAMPLWGVWLDGGLWFGTGLESVKGRNLLRDPRAVVHTESGDDVVILEGTAVRAEDDAAYTAYAAKYDMEASAAAFAALPQVGALFRFTPEIAHTWLEVSFETSRATFRLA